MEKKITQNSVGKRLWLNTLLATSILGLGISATPIAVHAEDINNTVQSTSPDTHKTKNTNLNARVTNNDDGSQTIKVELPANKVKGNDQKLNFVATDIDADSDGSQEHQTVDSGKIQRKNDNISFKVNLSSTALSNKTLMTDPLKITLLNSKGETIATIEGITLGELQDMAKNNASDTSSSNSTATSDKTDSSSNASSSTASSENKANNLSAASNMNPNGSTEASLANNTVTSTPSQASSAATPTSSTASMANMNPNGNSSANSASSSSAEASGSSSPANSSSNPNSASSANTSSASSSPASENSQSKADQALPQTGNTNQFYLTIAGVVILAGAIGAYVGLKTRKK